MSRSLVTHEITKICPCSIPLFALFGDEDGTMFSKPVVGLAHVHELKDDDKVYEFVDGLVAGETIYLASEASNLEGFSTTPIVESTWTTAKPVKAGNYWMREASDFDCLHIVYVAEDGVVWPCTGKITEPCDMSKFPKVAWARIIAPL